MLGLIEGRLVITSSSSATGVDGDEYDGSDVAFGEGGSAASSHKRARAVDDFFSSPFTYDWSDGHGGIGPLWAGAAVALVIIR